MEIGAALRDARENRGLSLAEVSARTKIRIEQLRALEDNAFERLPERIFVRGFIRAYAREVGLDPESVVSHFHPEPAPVESADVAVAAGKPQAADVPPPRSTFEDARSGVVIPTAIRPWLAAAAVMVPLALYLLALPLIRRPAEPPQPHATQPPAAVREEPPPAPVATTGQALRVIIRVQRPCWVSATADDRRAIFRTMRPLESETIEVTNDLVLRLGDAGAVSLSIDGAASRPMGRSGQPVRTRITRDNYSDFLAAKE